MTTVDSAQVQAAYQRCAEITASQARNFSYGIRLLPEPKRLAMSALYALARRIDDIGDSDAPPQEKIEALAAVRKDVASLPGDPGDWSDRGDPVMVAVADAARRYPLPVSALEELIEGCEMDVTGTTYPTFDDLVGYCRRVAGTVGRLSLAIYGTPHLDPAGPDRPAALADDLGVALQVTNILRDIVEDYQTMGRVYLPHADLERFGLAGSALGQHLHVGPPDHGGYSGGGLGRLDLSGDEEEKLVALISFESGRAEEWYDRGLTLLPLLDRRSRACTAAMAGIYRRLLTRIRRDPAAVLRGRLSLPVWEKTAVAARALAVGQA